MPTWRAFNRAVYSCGLYEAQDVLVDTADVELLRMTARSGLRWRENLQRHLLYKDPSNHLMFMNPGLERVRVTKDYDLFIVVCQTYWDLLYVNAIDGWKDRCAKSLCWIDELWAASAPRYKNWLRALEQFDVVCIGSLSSVPALTSAIGRDSHWVAGGVDALRFTPFPNPPPRVVDVYSIGRRWDGMHRALLQLASDRKIFYMYDSLDNLANMRPFDHAQHRDLYANVAKRSRYYLVAPAKMNLPKDTEGQCEIGYRYFEGAAAGAVMIGQPARSESFDVMFGWPDSVIETRIEGTDILDVLFELSRDPERTEAIRHRNATESLLRHDWVYRWKRLFELAGVQPSGGMQAREKVLTNLAASDMAATKTARPAAFTESI